MGGFGLKLLRQTVERIILEALHFDTAEELALLVHTNSYRTHYILVSYHDAVEWLENKFKDPDEYHYIRDVAQGFASNRRKRIVLGAVRVHRLHHQTHWAAGEIKLIGALDGWGPTLYDIVMGEEPNGIMADRNQVSRSAYRVWDYYRKNRDDVIKKPLDSLQKKWTPDSFDDGDPGSTGDYGSSSADTHEDYLKDATSWVFDREPVPQAQLWKRNGQRIITLLENHFDDKRIGDFFFGVVGATYDYYSSHN